MSEATRNQAAAQLAEAQKATNALKKLLANPAQWPYEVKITERTDSDTQSRNKK